MLRELGLVDTPIPITEPYASVQPVSHADGSLWLGTEQLMPPRFDVLPPENVVSQIVDEVADAPAAVVRWLSPTAAADPERAVTPATKSVSSPRTNTSSSAFKPMSFALPQYGRRGVQPASNLPLYLVAGAAVLGVLFFATRK